jgi:4-diphosphocytidyl-2-C-methyl-D-erythritol kinase
VPFVLAGGPALVEGRGERVTPLSLPRGEPPGVLLVTPAAPLSTAAAFRALDTEVAARPANTGSTRLSSEHLAPDLVLRAGVLAVANDLANAADLVLPGLRPLRRALTRLLGVPIGLSGSGPTLWALYPALADAEAAAARVREEVALGLLDSPGDGPPFVTATTIAAASAATAATAAPPGRES